MNLVGSPPVNIIDQRHEAGLPVYEFPSLPVHYKIELSESCGENNTNSHCEIFLLQLVRYRSIVSKQVAAELEISIKDACVIIPTHQIKLMETYDRGDTRQGTMNEGKQFEALIFHIFVFMCMSARIRLRIVAIDESSRKRACFNACFFVDNYIACASEYRVDKNFNKIERSLDETHTRYSSMSSEQLTVQNVIQLRKYAISVQPGARHSINSWILDWQWVVSDATALMEPHLAQILYTQSVDTFTPDDVEYLFTYVRSILPDLNRHITLDASAGACSADYTFLVMSIASANVDEIIATMSTTPALIFN